MTGQELVLPATGEVVSLDAPTDVLAEVLDQIRELESQLRAARAEISDEVLSRMDHEGVWTVHAGGIKLTGQSPGLVEYDAQALYDELTRLVKRELISPRAAESAVKVEQVFKVQKRGINALLKLGGEVAEAVKSHERPAEGRRRLSLSLRTAA